MAAKYRLGCQVYSGDGPCPACLQRGERYGGERITCHNNLHDHLHDLAAAAALNPTKESRGLIPCQERRPAGIFILSWAGGRDVAFDVTVVNPLQDATVVAAAATPGYTLKWRYGKKMTGAAEHCQREGIQFLPLVVESQGGWHKVAQREVKKLAAAKARQGGQEEEGALRNMWTRLTILLQRRIAAILHNHNPMC